MWQVVYKVTCEYNGQYFSSDVQSAKLEYKIGALIRPKIFNSKLFVFKNVDSAKQYWGLGHILKCLGKNVMKTPELILESNSCYEDKVYNFWNVPYSCDGCMKHNHFYDSYVCDELIPFEVLR